MSIAHLIKFVSSDLLRKYVLFKSIKGRQSKKNLFRNHDINCVLVRHQLYEWFDGIYKSKSIISTQTN